MLIDFELLSGAIPQQVAVMDKDGRYILANAAFEHRYGVARDQLVGKQVADVLSQELAEQYRPCIERALSGEASCVDHTFASKSEGRAWKTSFVPTPEGGCIVISDDPGSQIGHAIRSQRTEERLKTFIEFAPIGMIFSHLDGRVFEANKAYLDLIGYTREELERGEIHWDRLTPPEQLHLDYEAIAEAKKVGFSRTYEKEYITKSGERIHILVGFILVEPHREEAVAFVVDITAQKRSEEEILRLNADLEERVQIRTADYEEANRELEAFCYSVSHDLRAPLRSIDGFGFALFQDYGDRLDDEAVDYINRIRKSVKHMDELISALLVLSRITRVELEKETVDLSDLVNSVAADLRNQNPEREIEIDIQPNMTVKADRRMLRVVIDNLMNNALKFTARSPEAIISVGQEKPSGTFYIKDNGVGFDMEHSSKLFQPFERLHSPREFTGSGIGLATVQRIVRKHGGRIWAKAEVDRGATFYFTL